MPATAAVIAPVPFPFTRPDKVLAPVPPLATGKVPLYEVAVTAPHEGALDPFDSNTCPEVPAGV